MKQEGPLVQQSPLGHRRDRGQICARRPRNSLALIRDKLLIAKVENLASLFPQARFAKAFSQPIKGSLLKLSAHSVSSSAEVEVRRLSESFIVGGNQWRGF